MNTITKAKTISRLQALSARAKKGIPKERFKMDRYVTRFDQRHNCGLICCLAGWLPALFPTSFKWFRDATGWTVRLLGGTFDMTGAVKRFFGIDDNIFRFIFLGRAMYDNQGYELLPAVESLRTVTRDEALRRLDRAITMIDKGIVRR